MLSIFPINKTYEINVIEKTMYTVFLFIHHVEMQTWLSSPLKQNQDWSLSEHKSENGELELKYENWQIFFSIHNSSFPELVMILIACY